MRFVQLLGIFSIAAGAQSLPETVIRTATRLVQLRVAAEDSRGQPVAGLHKDDFTINDDGKPQPITVFASDGKSTSDASAGFTMVLVDRLNPGQVDRIVAEEALDRLLQRFQPGQRVGLYLLAREPRQLVGFIDDRDLLRHKLASAGFEVDESRPAGWPTLRFLDFNPRIKTTLQTLEAIAGRMARLRGQKSLIWISNGIPLMVENVGYLANLEEVIRKFNAADVAIHAVDICRLRIRQEPDDYVVSLQVLAERTGGKLFHDRNDLDEGVRLALEDHRFSYNLGFTVPAHEQPGIHKLEVRTARAGIKLRYRESYQLDDAGAPPHSK